MMARLPKTSALAALTALAVAFAASPSDARPDARAMTCSQVQALLAQEHAVTFTTGPNTFARYVAPGSCDGTRVGRPAMLSTKDTNQCTVHVCGPRVQNRRND
jgi:hypothetical protein